MMSCKTEPDVPNDNEASEPYDWKDEPVMPVDLLLPPFRRDSPLGRHFAELDAESDAYLEEGPHDESASR